MDEFFKIKNKRLLKFAYAAVLLPVLISRIKYRNCVPWSDIAAWLNHDRDKPRLNFLVPYVNWSEIGHVVDCIVASLHHALLQCPPTLTLHWAIVVTKLTQTRLKPVCIFNPLPTADLPANCRNISPAKISRTTQLTCRSTHIIKNGCLSQEYFEVLCINCWLSGQASLTYIILSASGITYLG